MTLYASALYIVARNLKFEFLYNWAIESVLIGLHPILKVFLYTNFYVQVNYFYVRVIFSKLVRVANS